jgi:hypothetical protein
VPMPESSKDIKICSKSLQKLNAKKRNELYGNCRIMKGKSPIRGTVFKKFAKFCKNCIEKGSIESV